MRLPWQLFSWMQNFHFWSSFFCFYRVSNHEKKLEAVRSGVRAISVSGKIEIILSTSSFRRLPSSVVPSTVFPLYLPISYVIFCSLTVSISLIRLTLLHHSLPSPFFSLHSHPFTFFSTVERPSSSPDWLQT